MKKFLTGEIQKIYRGNFIAIVTTDRHNPDKYDPFIQDSVTSEDFIYLTGEWRAHNTLERVYIGINKKAADLVTASLEEVIPSSKYLETLDEQLITINGLIGEFK